jgi:ligand-binding SRPBCC domain-containing protein
VASTFTLVTESDLPVDELFDASLSIDAHLDSMAHSRERAIAGVTSGMIGLGETVTWRARHFGVWFTMTSRITELERPRRFVDEQVSGPFRSFRHEHTFTVESGRTRMTDTLTIGSPVFGRLAERLVLVPYLRRLIRRRNAHLLASP